MTKKIILYIFAIVIALLLAYDFTLSITERILLIGLFVVLMALFTAVYIKQEEREKAKKDAIKQKIDFELEEMVESKTKTCIYCGTVNPIEKTYCKKCKMSMRKIICPVCQHTNPYNQKYCEECDSILQNKQVHL